MGSEETRLKNILQKLQDPQISLKESIDLYRSANIDWPATLDKKRKGKEVKEYELKFKLIDQLADKQQQFFTEPLGVESEERKRKLPQLSDEKFDFIELLCNEMVSSISYFYFNWNSFTDTEKERLKNTDFLKGSEKTLAEVESEIKEVFEETSPFISDLKSERNRREKIKNQEQNQPNPTSSLPDSSNSVNINLQSLQQQLKNLQDQINKLTNNLSTSTADNSSDDMNMKQLNQISQKLNSLQKELQNKESNSNPSEKQEITKLKNQLNQLQKDLKNKQISREKETNSQTQNDKFNWLYVVIPGGILLVIMIAITAYLLGKSKKESKK